MADTPCSVIIGAGLAGDTAAGALRAAGWDGRIVMIGDEAHLPYDRPPLSKAALGHDHDDAALRLRAPGWCADQAIELHLGDAAIGIDTKARRVALRSGARIDFDKLLIATGARPRRLDALARGPAPVHTLRTLDDAIALRRLCRPGARIAIVGGGVIGLEVAASTVRLGCSACVIEAAPRLLARSAAPVIADFLAARHRAQGVRIFCAARVVAVDADGAAASRLHLADGTAITADLIVVGIGVIANDELARQAGLATADGIIVDRHTRTSHQDIHAAGDVARYPTATGDARAEHWRAAIDQATIAARVMAGETCAYIPAPWVWTDQYDLHVQFFGRPHGDAGVVRGKMHDDAFCVFHLDQGRIVGATTVNQPRHKRQIARLVEQGGAVDPARLADTAIDLKTLMSEADVVAGKLPESASA